MSKGNAVSVDREVPDVIDDLAPIGGWSMTRVDPVAELAAFEAAAELQKKLIVASVRATKAQDWVEMGGKVYLQSTGIERISALWGLVFGEPAVTKEEYGGGEYGYVVSGPIGSRRTGVFYKAITGGRSSADPFFDAFDEDKPRDFKQLPAGEQAEWKRAHRIPPDPLDVRKAAITNWTVRGASMLTGMRGLTAADLKAAGIEGVARVEYGTGARGGATAPGDLKAAQTALWNECLKRTGGDVEAASGLLRDVTKYDAYTNKSTGKKVEAHPGHTDVAKISNPKTIEIATSKLAKHAVFGDDALDSREPGQEG